MNLSTLFTLTKQQRNLLNKGLSFIPTITATKHTRQDITMDVHKYHRRLKLADFFGQQPPPQGKTFQEPSEWEPRPDQLSTALLTLIEKNGRHLTGLEYTPEKSNLPPEEEQALRELRSTRGIVIKPADKGSVVVIMDLADYTAEAHRQLQDTEYYTPLQEPIYMETTTLIEEELKKLQKDKKITRRQLEYLRGKRPPRPRYFYLLPKIHKPMEKWTIPHRIPPGRPIISDCGSESNGTAEYLDHFLTPLSTKHASYIKNTQDFLDRISSLSLKEPCLLFTMDVSSLYTNIEIPLGMAAIQRILNKFPDPTRPDEALMRLLEINLKRNDFNFQDRFYLQTKGTAMGKRFAPAYANIYMAEWEETAFKKCQQLPQIYLRYLDDIFGIWTHSEEEFNNFTKTLNSHHASIKVEPQLNTCEVNFLDTTIYKGPTFSTTGKLDSKLYVKPTDNHALLHKNSFHPKHVFSGILKSQLLRFSRICSQPQDQIKARKDLFAALRKRGYSRQLLRKAQKTTQTPRENTNTDPRQKIPLIVTYSTHGKRLTRTLRRNFEDITRNTTLAENFRTIPAYRRNPNLKQILVRAKISTAEKTKPRTNNWRVIRNNSNGYTHRLPRNIPRTQTNCIYAIKCTKCGKLYIGETGNALNTRMTQHRYVIRTHTTSPSILAKHFQEHGNNNLIMQPLEHDPKWTRDQRRKRERHWINKLSTYFPQGLNERKPGIQRPTA